MRKFLYGLLVFVLLFAGVGMLYVWEVYLDDYLNYTEVVVATTQIEPNTRITENHVTIEKRRTDSLASDSVINLDNVLDTHILSFIDAKDVITQSKLDFSIKPDREHDIFAIPNSWMLSAPVTLKRYDQVNIFLYKRGSSEGIDLEEISQRNLRATVNSDKPILENVMIMYLKDSTTKEVFVEEGSDNNRLRMSATSQNFELLLSHTDFAKLKRASEQGFHLIFSY